MSMEGAAPSEQLAPEAPTAQVSPAAPKPARRPRWLVVLVALYALATLITVILMRLLVDKSWVATILAFSPRWLIALPAPFVLGACLYKRDWKLLPVVPACLLAQLFLVGGFRLGTGCSSVSRDKSIRILTQNADRVPFDTGWFANLTESEDLDLVLVQECPVHEFDKPTAPLGYYVAVDAGTCLFSRFPIAEEDRRPRADVWARGGSGAIALYRIDREVGSFYLMNVHLATVREGLNGFRKFLFGGRATMKESIELRDWESSLALEWSHRAKGPLIVAGDFNLPEESAIFKEHWGSFGNAFDACGRGFGYSKETVVRHVEFGTRIDHVLFDDHWECHDAHLAPPIGSDHRGMIAVLSLR
jgi:vancomycin resistance protein VanJ